MQENSTMTQRMREMDEGVTGNRVRRLAKKSLLEAYDFRIHIRNKKLEVLSVVINPCIFHW